MEKLFAIIRATHSTFSGDVSTTLRLQIAAMGLAEESGEVLSLIKKNIEQGRLIDRDKLGNEMADVLYYLGLACLATGEDLDSLVNRLDVKLSKRYPKGFNPEDALARVDVE